MKTVYLQLKDGTIFEGKTNSNISNSCFGEVVFNTSMIGYQEILSDPSYNGQIVLLTYPSVGNYGIDYSFNESSGIKATALLIKEEYTGEIEEGRISLREYLDKENIPLITNLDTRSITLHIRDNGSQNGLLYTDLDHEKAREELNKLPSITERDLIDGVSVKEAIKNPKTNTPAPKNEDLHIALVDFGVKLSIIENFYKRNCAVTLLPPTTKSSDILNKDYDMLFLSNGPGDPEYLKEAVQMTKECITQIPVCGICLGHQIITLALGGKTVKMPFGHHGGNQPVKDLDTNKTFVTSQNHGFMSDKASLPKDVSIWFENANDKTVEGLYQKEKKVRSVQFHPEASPGPEDAMFIFDSFIAEAK